MDFPTILLIALALAVDAFAVAMASGVCLRVVDRRQTFRLAFHFGLFQGGMTVLGWAAGLTFRALIESFDHWLAFGLLAFVGGKMIREALQHEEDRPAGADPTRGTTLVVLAVATSIDALAVGLSFAVLGVSVWQPAAVIALVALLLTGFGLHLGCRMAAASRLGARVEIAGGLVLLAIGVRILHEHGVF